jgi:uncharacterized membrane protein YvbJ
MAYCTRCGTLNTDDATVCVKCGAPLQGAGEPYTRHWRWEDQYARRGRRGGGLFALAIGLIIIFIGLTLFVEAIYNVNIPLGSILLILFGVFIIAAGLRARRYWR